MRRLPALIIVLVICTALTAPAAHASRAQSTTFDAPRDLLDASARAQGLADVASLGARSLRVVLYWRDVAPSPASRIKPAFDPTDPAAYAWGRYDALIDDATARGLSVLLTLSGPVPRWATNGARDQVTRPSPNEFRMFVQAAARHYGTRIATWSVWNEPNQPQFLMPQYSTRGRPQSPRIYRGLYFAAIRGLTAAGLGSAQVLFGETSPRGTGSVVAPLTFLRGALCLDSSYRRSKSCGGVPMSGYAHHAYTTAKGTSFKPSQPNDVTIGVLSRLTKALDRAARAKAISARMPVWLTEFGIESVPDPLRGVSQQRQAEDRSIAERIAWNNPRIASFSQYLLRDDPAVAGAKGVARYSGFQTGLRTAAGTAKRAYDGFRLPLVAWRAGVRRVSLWGYVRPAAATTRVAIEYSSNGRSWREFATVTTDARGYFTRSAADVSARQWRLRWTAPDGTDFRGAATRVYGR